MIVDQMLTEVIGDFNGTLMKFYIKNIFAVYLFFSLKIRPFAVL